MITVPPVGGSPPTVTLGGSSVVPTRRLTDVGGDFIGWAHDGEAAHYSIGRSFFRYDVAVADSIAREDAARRDERDEPEKEEDGRERGDYRGDRVDVEITAQKDRPRGTVVLRGARIITMNGDEVIESGDLVVEDNRIAAVGPSGEVSIPDDAEVLEHTLPISPFYDDVVRLGTFSGITYTPSSSRSSSRPTAAWDAARTARCRGWARTGSSG